MTPAELARSLDPRSLAVLAGAGVSIPSPSNLLPGAAFTANVLARAGPKDAPVEWLTELAKPPPGRHRPGEALRFEALMAALVASRLDPGLRVLDCVEDCRVPNAAHAALAALVDAGSIVMTVNFDLLIELAYERRLCRSAQPLRVAAFDDDFPTDGSWRGRPPTLWKLHGSLSVGGASTRESIQATLPAVLAPAMSERKRAFLADVLADRDLLVVGYSGSDDFDVVPVLEDAVSRHRLVWVDHVEAARKVTAVPSEVSMRLHPDVVGRERIRYNRAPDGSEIRRKDAIEVVRTDTGLLLPALAPDAQADGDGPEHPFGAAFPEATAVYFERWESELAAPPTARYRLLELLLEPRAHREDVARRLEWARRGCWSSGRRRRPLPWSGSRDSRSAGGRDRAAASRCPTAARPRACGASWCATCSRACWSGARVPGRACSPSSPGRSRVRRPVRRCSTGRSRATRRRETRRRS